MLLPSLPRAGMEVVAASLATVLRARDHDVGFTCIEGPGDLGLELREAGFRVSVVPATGLWPNIVARELGSWLAELRPDVVHVHNGLWLKALTAAQHAQVPRTIYTLHGIDVIEPWYTRHMNRLAARRTTRVVAVSETLRDYLHHNARVRPECITVIPNGVSTERFRPGERSDAERESLGLPGVDRRLIGIVARLDHVKNHALLIDAFSLLVPERPDAFLVIVGDGPLRSQLERQIERLNLQQHVRITGVLPDPAPILRQLDVFALSSEIEGTSMSILEAMATGLPIVATAVGGTPRLLRDGACGVLTPPGDAGAFGRALLDVLADQDAARHRGIQARETVRAEHSLEHMADQYETIYAGHEFSAQRPAMTRRS